MAAGDGGTIAKGKRKILTAFIMTHLQNVKGKENGYGTKWTGKCLLSGKILIFFIIKT